jgi:hypothetical protein
MIKNGTELPTTQERIVLFERVPAEARKIYYASNYKVMAEGYLLLLRPQKPARFFRTHFIRYSGRGWHVGKLSP